MAGLVRSGLGARFPWGTLVLNLVGCFAAGATVLRGYLGYGAHRRIHTARILRLSEDLPIVVEIVDALEKTRTSCRSSTR